jgi:Ca-activated chloride channel family protein
MKYQPITLIALVVLGLFSCTAPALRHEETTDDLEQDPAVVTPQEPAARTPEALAVSASEMRERGKIAADAVGGVRYDLHGRYNPNFNTESYAHIVENVFLSVAANPLSTFSIDVDRASYSNVRRFINQGQRPPIDAVRIEELINYFHYDYPDPDGEHPFSITTEVTDAPWNPLHKLVRIGIQAEEIDTENLPPANLVFLLDVSGSMQSPDKLPLLKASFRMLVNELRPQDRVAIVVYAGAAGLVLPSTPGDQKDTILAAIEALEAGGSTAGGEGIILAYEIASENHIDGGNNRVILATDGDFNVGASSDAAMVRLIEEKREQGTFLTVLGFGTGNLKDSKMEQLADHGNGNFAYIDNLMEARKVLVTEIGGTLLTIAKDVKIQVEFNPTRVAAYRLIGYENRLLADEDFNDDTKDAGELGAGHSVTALYEVIPIGVDSPYEIRGVDSLRYQSPGTTTSRSDSPELMFVKLRYKEPDGDESRLIERPALDAPDEPSVDLRFAAAVAGFGMILRESEYCGDDWTLADVLELARGATGGDSHGYRAEFVRLVEAVNSMELLAQATY